MWFEAAGSVGISHLLLECSAAAAAAALLSGSDARAAAARSAAVQAFMGERLEPSLVRALAELARAKPAGAPDDAAAWLARWLLDHGPAQAREEGPEFLNRNTYP